MVIEMKTQYQCNTKLRIVLTFEIKKNNKQERKGQKDKLKQQNQIKE